MNSFVVPTENSLVSIIVPLSLNEDYCYVGNLERFALTGEKPINHIVRYYEEPADLRQLHERIAAEIERRKDNFQQIANDKKFSKRELFVYIPLILAGLVPAAIPLVGDEIKKIIEGLGNVGGAIGGTAAALADPFAVMRGHSIGDKLFSSIPFLAGSYGLVKSRVKKHNFARNAEIENEFRREVCDRLDGITDDVRYQLLETNIHPLYTLFQDNFRFLLEGEEFVRAGKENDYWNLVAFRMIASNVDLMNRANYGTKRYLRTKAGMNENGR